MFHDETSYAPASVYTVFMGTLGLSLARLSRWMSDLLHFGLPPGEQGTLFVAGQTHGMVSKTWGQE